MLTLPTTLNERYRLLDRLGSGGLADVYRAEDLVLERAVAVKIVRDTTEVHEQPFAREIAALARLSHPVIVRLYDGGTYDDAAYLVMELVEGRTLHEVIAADAPLDAELVRKIGASVASALAHAHDVECVHRDVKPGNILLDDEGRVRVTDFGVARLVDSSVTTVTGTIGTVAYLAPEQVESGAVTPAADVYALGLVLLECFTGEREFTGSWTEAALVRLHRDPAIPDHLPAPWPELLTRMTQRASEDRPSAADVARELEGLASSRPSTSTAPAPPATERSDDDDATRTQVLERTTTDALRRRASALRELSQSNRWLALVVIGLILIAGWLFLRSDEPADDPAATDDAAEVEEVDEPEAEVDEAGAESDEAGADDPDAPPATLDEAIERLEEAVQP